MAKNFIKGAIKNPGSLTRAAKAAGKNISQFCAGNVSPTNRRRCNLAKTLNRLRPRGRRRG